MKCFGQLKSVTVWLVLLGFLCGMMVPSVVMGKVFRDIDTEGDPGDGLGLTDGGAGSGGGFVAPDTQSGVIESTKGSYGDFEYYWVTDGILLNGFWVGGKIISIVLHSDNIFSFVRVR